MRHPKSYFVQDPDRCANCKFVCRVPEWEDCEAFYCNHDESKRPLCGSVWINEHRPNFWVGKLGRIWDKWRKGRQVNSMGVCSKHERSK
jgi:hypothetical protein